VGPVERLLPTDPVAPALIPLVFAMVLDGLDSQHSKRAYGRALAEFHAWWVRRNVGMVGPGAGEPRVVDYAAVAQWRAELVAEGR